MGARGLLPQRTAGIERARSRGGRSKTIGPTGLERPISPVYYQQSDVIAPLPARFTGVHSQTVGREVGGTLAPSVGECAQHLVQLLVQYLGANLLMVRAYIEF